MGLSEAERNAWKLSQHPAPTELEEYCEIFALAPDDLRGKKILDAGAGYCRFAYDAARKGIAEIVSLEPRLALGKTKLQIQSCLSRHMVPHTLEGVVEFPLPENIVAGLIEDLPFPEETFDLVFAKGSIPLWSASTRQTIRGINEMLRVCKTGGQVLIWPLGWTLTLMEELEGKIHVTGFRTKREFEGFLKTLKATGVKSEFYTNRRESKLRRPKGYCNVWVLTKDGDQTRRRSHLTFRWLFISVPRRPSTPGVARTLLNLT